MKKKILGLMVCTLCLGMSLFAGGQQGKTGTEAAGPAAVELWIYPSVSEAGMPPADWKAIPLIKERVNVDLKWSMVPSSNNDWDVKINAAAAANALPDIFEVRREPWYQLVKAGLIAPVDDLYPLMPKRTAYHYTAESRAYTTVNGKSYGLASPGSLPRNEGMLIRKDWLDKLGLKIPVTTAEYLNVMRAFTTNDPDGNGKNDTYGYGAFVEINTYEEGLGRRFDPFFGAFGLAGTWNLTKAGAGLNVRKPAYYDALEYVKSIIDGGGIDPNWISYNKDDFRAAWKQGRFGLMRENHSAYASDNNYAPFDQNFPRGEWIVIDPPKGPQGQSSVGVSIVNYRVFVVSTKAMQAGKGPAIARLLEWMADGEGYYLLGWGEEGINYVKDKDGVPSISNLPDPNKAFTRADVIPITQLRHLIYYNSDVELIARYPTYKSPSGKTMSALTVWRDMMNRPWTANDGGDTLTVPNADLKRFYEQGVMEFLTGKRQFNRANWTAWVAEFDRLGGLDWEKAGIAAAEAGGYIK